MSRLEAMASALTTAFRLSVGAPWLLLFLWVVGLEPRAFAEDGGSRAGRASLKETVLSAKGTSSTILTIPTQGRYAVRVFSEQGVALKVVDPVSGPGPVAGEPGVLDGRLDLLLEAGTYRVTLLGHEKNSGNARLEVTPFVEQAGLQLPTLEPERLLTAELRDFEQRSYELLLPETRDVRIEAAGRHLTELAVWLEGTWRMAGTTSCEQRSPSKGQPVNDCVYSARLAPGRYVVSTYGGPGLSWSVDGARHEVHVLYGIPSLPSTGSLRRNLSPLGRDTYLVPGSTPLYVLKLDESAPVQLEVSPTDPEYEWASNYTYLTKESTSPVAELEMSASDDYEFYVTVTGLPGQAYTLFWLQPSYRPHGFSGNGTYWLSSIETGATQDSLDASGLIFASRPGRAGYRIVDTSGPRVGRDEALIRKFNLQGSAAVLVRVVDPGVYRVTVSGTDAVFRLEPIVLDSSKYRQPPLERLEAAWDLEPGLYQLAVASSETGIVDLAMWYFGPPRHSPTPPATAEEAQKPPVTSAPLPVRITDTSGSVPENALTSVRATSVHFPQLTIETGTNYSFLSGVLPASRTGVILRPVPIDLSQPLFITQVPEEKLPIQVTLPGAGRVVAMTDDGSNLRLSSDGLSFFPALELPEGAATVYVRVEGTIARGFTLQFVPTAMGQAPASNKVPVLTLEKSINLDLEPQGVATASLKVTTPALYQIRSSGLLALQGTLRSPTRTSLASGMMNGPGRNMVLQSYLEAGEYQLTLQALGQTRGRAGLTLERLPLSALGRLSLEVPGLSSFPEGGGGVYEIDIPRRGDYRIASIGQGRGFFFRLQDAEGWPLDSEAQGPDLTVSLEAGRYRLLLMPDLTEGRRTTLIRALPESETQKGHGPHVLPLAKTLEHLYLSPPNRPPAPDVWMFTLPASTPVAIRLTGEMEVRLFAKDATSPKATLTSAVGFDGLLEEGEWRLEATCRRRDHEVPYSLAVWPQSLTAGLSWWVTAPVTLPVAVGTGGITELESFGSTDVRARLRDAEGRLLLENDDRPGGWGFHLLSALPPGSYTLEVQSVTPGHAGALIAHQNRPEVPLSPLSAPGASRFQLERAVNVIPLQMSGEGLALVVSAKASESVGCELEQKVGNSWRSLALEVGVHPLLAVRLDGAPSMDSYRLRLWSVDRKGGELEVSVQLASPAEQKSASDSVTLTSIPTLTVGAAYLTQLSPGLLSVKGSSSDVLACPKAKEACTRLRDGRFALSSDSVLLLAPLEVASQKASSARLELERHILLQGASQTLPLERGARGVLDLDAARGQPLLILARSQEVTVGLDLEQAPLAVGHAGTAVVVLEAPLKPAVSVWGADSAGRPLAGQSMAVVTSYSFPQPEHRSIVWGNHEGQVASRQAVSLELPAGLKRLRVTLGHDLAATLSTGVKVSGLIWQDGKAFTEQLETESTRLTFLNSGLKSSTYQIEVIALSPQAATPPLRLGHPYERRFAAEGRLRIPVEMPSTPGSYRIKVAGAVTEALLVQEDGRTAAGLELPLASPGLLFLSVRPGLGMAWIEAKESEAEALFSELPPSKAVQTVPVPMLLSLSGTAQTFRISAAQARAVRLEAAVPFAALFRSGQGAPLVALRLEGGGLELVSGQADAGSTGLEVTLRGLAGASLSGELRILPLNVSPLKEGVGASVQLEPGGTRFYTLDLKQEARVGIALRAERDVVTCRLMTASGDLVAEGPAQVVSLKPGAYLLSLHLSASERPISVAPVLVGLTPQGLEPPADVLERYRTTRGDEVLSRQSVAPPPSYADTILYEMPVFAFEPPAIESLIDVRSATLEEEEW